MFSCFVRIFCVVGAGKEGKMLSPLTLEVGPGPGLSGHFLLACENAPFFWGPQTQKRKQLAHCNCFWLCYPTVLCSFNSR